MGIEVDKGCLCRVDCTYFYSFLANKTTIVLFLVLCQEFFQKQDAFVNYVNSFKKAVQMMHLSLLAPNIKNYKCIPHLKEKLALLIRWNLKF